MRITTIEAIPVRVPLKAGMTTKTAHGDHVTSDYVIVRVHTDDGLVGLGEATVAARWSGETSRSCVAAIDDLIGPALAGADPTRIHALRAVMDRELKLNPFTKAAVEMALWDLSGKAAGVPVYKLLGGKVHDTIPIKMMIGAFDIPRSLRARRAVPHLGRPLPEGEGRPRPGGRRRAGRGGPQARRARHPDHRRLQLRLERHHRPPGPASPPGQQPARRRAADPPRRLEAMAALADARRHPDHGRRERLHARRRLERRQGPRGRRHQRLSRQERRHPRLDRDRPRRPGGRALVPHRQQPRARHRQRRHAPPGRRDPRHRQRDLPGRHPRAATTTRPTCSANP